MLARSASRTLAQTVMPPCERIGHRHRRHRHAAIRPTGPGPRRVLHPAAALLRAADPGGTEEHRPGPAAAPPPGAPARLRASGLAPARYDREGAGAPGGRVDRLDRGELADPEPREGRQGHVRERDDLLVHVPHPALAARALPGGAEPHRRHPGRPRLGGDRGHARDASELRIPFRRDRDPVGDLPGHRSGPRLRYGADRTRSTRNGAACRAGSSPAW